MKKLVVLLCMMKACLLQAQPFTVSGKIKDDNQAAAVSVNVLLCKKTDSSLVKISHTDKLGGFRIIGINQGLYFLKVNGVSFSSYESMAFQLAANMQLNDIILQKNSSELAAVTVSTIKPMVQVMADKTVFNVQNSLSATRLSGFDVLRKAPGVMIDNQDNLIVEGKTGVSIFIDGKISPLSGQDLTNYLKSLQSTDIEAIEIITQPSSRYDAAGNAGIINIRLKKNKSYGTNGSFTVGYAIGKFSKYNSALSINSRSSKINFFSSYSNNIGKNRGYLNLDRFQSGFEYDQRSFNISKDNSHNVRAGLDYTLSPKNTIGVLVSANFSGSNSTNTSRTPIVNIADKQVQQVLLANGFTTNNNHNLAANINYRFADKKNHELTMDVDYGNYRSDRDNIQPNYYYNSSETSLISQIVYRMVTPVHISLLSAKADYSQDLWKAKIATGFKISSVKTNNIFGFYDENGRNEQYNTLRSNTFDYTENINAAYINLSRNYKKMGLQLGLRAEQTISDGELTSVQQNQDGIVKRSYLDLFPSGGISYSINPKNNVALTFSRRVERPNYRSLNPFEYNLDQLSFSKGNPFLRPQYTNTFKLSHTFNYTLNTSISYSKINDFFAQITDTLGNNRNYISPQNIANQQVFDISVSYAFNANKWWNIYANANAYRSIYTSANPKFIPINQNTLGFYAQNTFSLPKGYRLEVSGWFSSPSIWSGTYHTNGLGSLDIAAQKMLANNRMSIRVAISDILKSSNWTGTTQYGQLFIKGSGGYESRQLRISLNYNFGRKEIKAAQKRISGAEDEKDRIKN